MADNILSVFFDKAMFVIGGFGGSKATALKISKVSAKFVSMPMRHMKEDGTTVVDVRILKPTTVVVETMCPDLDTQKQVNDILMDRNNFYFITSKGLVIDNLMLDHEQIRQTAEVLSASPISLSFKQVITPTIEVTAQSADSSLLNRGMMALNSATQTVTGLYSKASSAISSLL